MLVDRLDKQLALLPHLLHLLGRQVLIILLAGQYVFDLLVLLEHENHFSLPLPDLERVSCVLLVKLDQGLLQLKNFLICQMNFFHDSLLLFFVFEPHRAVAWNRVSAGTLCICRLHDRQV
jgi:hypothetical protein